jgi:hypothetical protein
LENGQLGDQIEEISLLHTIQLIVVEQPAAPREPAVAAGKFAGAHQPECHPERTARRPRSLVQPEVFLMRTCPDIGTVVVLAYQVGRHRESLEVIDLQRRHLVGGGQLGERVPPRLPGKGKPAPL